MGKFIFDLILNFYRAPMRNRGKQVVVISSLCKSFEIGDVSIRAIDNIDFTVAEGELVAIRGPSGAGKTTLLNIIGGLDSPTSGEIWVLGQNLTECDEEYLATFRCAYIGFVFQSYNLISTLTTTENIAFPMELAQWPEAHIKGRTKELLEMVGLLHRANHFPSQLSGGEQQRVAFARALANNALLILADEPTGNLDMKTSKIIISIFERLKTAGKTQIVVTHDKEILQLADRVVHIKDGRTIQA
ncbi:MAG: ABC transporter ATP-binding protein [Candidatus Bathyarchaeota archaeon]|nr:MAG: ABC transporter ATP-binding protein [Candidatus Bathyarchaeota archaeon]